MSGDIGIHEETVVFYDKTMTETKMVLLKLKGIQLNYHREESEQEEFDLIWGRIYYSYFKEELTYVECIDDACIQSKVEEHSY